MAAAKRMVGTAFSFFVLSLQNFDETELVVSRKQGWGQFFLLNIIRINDLNNLYPSLQKAFSSMIPNPCFLNSCLVHHFSLNKVSFDFRMFVPLFLLS